MIGEPARGGLAHLEVALMRIGLNLLEVAGESVLHLQREFVLLMHLIHHRRLNPRLHGGNCADQHVVADAGPHVDARAVDLGADREAGLLTVRQQEKRVVAGHERQLADVVQNEFARQRRADVLVFLRRERDAVRAHRRAARGADRAARDNRQRVADHRAAKRRGAAAGGRQCTRRAGDSERATRRHVHRARRRERQGKIPRARERATCGAGRNQGAERVGQIEDQIAVRRAERGRAAHLQHAGLRDVATRARVQRREAGCAEVQRARAVHAGRTAAQLQHAAELIGLVERDRGAAGRRDRGRTGDRRGSRLRDGAIRLQCQIRERRGAELDAARVGAERERAAAGEGAGAGEMIEGVGGVERRAVANAEGSAAHIERTRQGIETAARDQRAPAQQTEVVAERGAGERERAAAVHRRETAAERTAGAHGKRALRDRRAAGIAAGAVQRDKARALLG
ncbi:hypothetical protein KCU90_g4488, partial [Aureobasidium melanogenum]